MGFPEKSHTLTATTALRQAGWGTWGSFGQRGAAGCPVGVPPSGEWVSPWVTMSSQATLRAEKEEAPPGAEAGGCAGTRDDTGWVTAWGLASWLRVNRGDLLNSASRSLLGKWHIMPVSTPCSYKEN